MNPVFRFVFALLLSLLVNLSTSAARAEDEPTGDAGAIDHIVALVDDAVILQSELDEMLDNVKRQLQQQDGQLPPDDVLRKQVLERLIMMRLQLQFAERTGIRIDEEKLNAALSSIAQQNNLSLGDFRLTLEREGFNFAHFRENIRDQMIISQLQQRQVNSLVTVSDQEVDNFLANAKLQGDIGAEYHLAHILIAMPEGASTEQAEAAHSKAQRVLDELRGGADFQKMAVSVSDAQQALEGGDLGWRSVAQIPAMFVEVVTHMKPGEVSDLVRSPSGFHIIKLLDNRGLDKHSVKQTHARHILIRTNDLVSDDDAKARLEQLQQRLEGGDDFAALARAHSDDAVSAAKGGDLGWINPGDLDPQFEEVMTGLAPSTFSAPFRTQFGWHLVQVLERRTYDDTKDFRRNMARELIRKRKAEEEIEIWLRRLRDEAYVEYRND
jgi:peptidyl-prolyl cis-trans isomerase SurA